MSSKEAILSNIKKNIKVSFEMPEININDTKYQDKLSQFIDMSRNVGGQTEFLEQNEDLNEKIRILYPDAKTIASNIPEITIANINPDKVATAQDLNGTDLAVVKGEFGVAENGCIWIPQTVKEKAVYFIAEYLVILLPRNNIVNNMHEAYERISFTDYGFGTFISGPSKTADIEQALVVGAQSARGITVMLL